MDKKEIGALLEELDGRHRQALRSSDDASDALDFLHAMEAHYPELRAYIRKAEKVIEAARAVRVVLSAEYQAHYRLWIADGNETDYQWLKRQPTLEAAQGLVIAALADLDEGDTDGAL